MKPRRKQKIKWSPELAYIVGLISTDGNLSNDKYHINFTSKDTQLLKTFKNCLGLKNKIGYKNSGFSNKKYSWIQFGDVILYKWLVEIGLQPNKTKRIKELKIPREFFFDFLRGHFDGDGSCCGYWDKRWKSSYMFYIYFNSASLSFIKWIRENLKNLLNVWGSISFTGSIWRIKYAKKESKLIFSKTYYKENLPLLKRKYKKLKTFLETETKNKTLRLNGRVVKLADTAV